MDEGKMGKQCWCSWLHIQISDYCRVLNKEKGEEQGFV